MKVYLLLSTFFLVGRSNAGKYYRGPPLTRNSLPQFLAYVRVSGGISVSRGPQYTLMRFLDLKETSTDMAADWIFEKFKLI